MIFWGEVGLNPALAQSLLLCADLTKQVFLADFNPSTP